MSAMAIVAHGFRVSLFPLLPRALRVVATAPLTALGRGFLVLLFCVSFTPGYVTSTAVEL